MDKLIEQNQSVLLPPVHDRASKKPPILDTVFACVKTLLDAHTAATQNHMDAYIPSFEYSLQHVVDYINARDNRLHAMLNCVGGPRARGHDEHRATPILIIPGEPLSLDTHFMYPIDTGHIAGLPLGDMETGYQPPVYVEYFAKMVARFGYQFMYALPFFCLKGIRVEKTIAERYVNTFAEASVPGAATADKLPSVNSTLDVLSVLNELFFRLTVVLPKRENEANREGPPSIELMLFAGHLGLTSAVRTLKRSSPLLQLYVLTNVGLEKNVALPLLYRICLETRGVLFRRTLPYEVNKIPVASIELQPAENRKTAVGADGRREEDTKWLLPPQTLNEYTELIYEKCIISRGYFNTLLLQATETVPMHVMPVEDVVFWLERGYLPSNVVVRRVVNVINNKHQDLDDRRVLGVYTNRFHQPAIMKIELSAHVYRVPSILPPGIYIPPPINDTFKFVRINQNCHYSHEWSTLFFCNHAFLGCPVVEDFSDFIVNTQTTAIHQSVFIESFQRAFNTTFLQDAAILQHSGIVLTRLTFEQKIICYILKTTVCDGVQTVDLFDFFAKTVLTSRRALVKKDPRLCCMVLQVLDLLQFNVSTKQGAGTI